MDLLADVLAVSGVRGTVAARIHAGHSWGWHADDVPGAAFHAVTAGTAWLGLPDQAPFQLLPGDVVLLPTGTHHTLSSAPDATLNPVDPAVAARARATGDALQIGTGPFTTHILCAYYDHDPAISTQVLTLLPPVVHLRADHGANCLDDTVRLLARELAHPQIATTVVLNSLVDILLVQLLRVWLTTRPDHDGTWLGVLTDPLISQALTTLHQTPDHPWSTAALAAELAVSRATLSRRFLTVVGQSPGAYLTQWRMDLAARRLRDSDDSLETVARSVGYTSVYAFSRAFSRARAQPPGQYRITSRVAVANQTCPEPVPTAQADRP